MRAPPAGRRCRRSAGCPRKPGTPVAADTPGTISTRTRARAHASACWEARLNRSGSPVNRRTARLAARWPPRSSLRGVGAGIGRLGDGRPLGQPVGQLAGQLRPHPTRSAWASSSAARSVSSPSSPGASADERDQSGWAGGASGLLVAGVGFTQASSPLLVCTAAAVRYLPPRGGAIHERPGVPGARPPRRGGRARGQRRRAVIRRRRPPSGAACPVATA